MGLQLQAKLPIFLESGKGSAKALIASELLSGLVVSREIYDSFRDREIDPNTLPAKMLLAVDLRRAGTADTHQILSSERSGGPGRVFRPGLRLRVSVSRRLEASDVARG